MNCVDSLTDKRQGACALPGGHLWATAARFWSVVRSGVLPKDLDAAGGGRSTATVEEPTDQQLIDASLTRGDNSFARLIERYEALVAGVLWHFTRDRHKLEELAQDTFVEAYFSLHRFKKGAPFLPWLRTIATRVGYKHWRHCRRERERTALGAEWQHVARPDSSAGPSDTAEYVYHMLERLEPKDRLVLTLQYFEQCDTTEIAERVGWSTALVKVRAFRARRRLKQMLEAEQKP